MSVHWSSAVTSWAHWFMDRMRYLTADTTKPKDWAHFLPPKTNTKTSRGSPDRWSTDSEGKKKTCSCETDINHRSFLDEKRDVFCLHGLFHFDCLDLPQFGKKTEAFSTCSLWIETLLWELILVDAIFECQLFNLLLTLFRSPLFCEVKPFQERN